MPPSGSRRSGSPASSASATSWAVHRGGYGTLADLAHACGYADQADMTRDFKDLTGRAPGEQDAFRARPLAGAPETRVVHRYRG